MSKLVVVVGATGVQGGSVVDAFLKDPSYKIRGLTRKPDGDAGLALAAKGVDVVAADLNDEASLVKAFNGAYAIFAVTNFFEPLGATGSVTAAQEIEWTQATNMVKAARQIPSLQHYIWSTLPNSTKTTSGKFPVPFMDTKAKVDEYIREDKEFAKKTTFFYLTFYASNLLLPNFLPIHVKSVNKYIQILPIDAKTPLASAGDTRVNTGLFVRAIINNPDRTRNGTYVLANHEDTTFGEYLAAWGKSSGLATNPDSTEVVPISYDSYRSVWPGFGDVMGTMLQFWDQFRDKSWSTSSGANPVDVLQFMTEAERKALVGHTECFAQSAYSQNV